MLCKLLYITGFPYSKLSTKNIIFQTFVFRCYITKWRQKGELLTTISWDRDSLLSVMLPLETNFQRSDFLISVEKLVINIPKVNCLISKKGPWLSHYSFQRKEFLSRLGAVLNLAWVNQNSFLTWLKKLDIQNVCNSINWKTSLRLVHAK